MTAPGGGRRDKTAEELLKEMLSAQEYLAVLEYSKAHAIESDSAVFFLVALLKVFAWVHARILDAIERAELGRRRTEQAANDGLKLIEGALGRRHRLIEAVMQDAADRIAFHTSELKSASGELKVLREQLETTVKDAKKAFAAYQHLKHDAETPALVELFHQRLTSALDRRMPAYDQVFRKLLLETIDLGMGIFRDSSIRTDRPLRAGRGHLLFHALR